MQFDLHAHQLVMIIGAIIALIVLMAGWPRRRIIGGAFFVCFCVAVAWWQIASTVESFVVEQSSKVLWSQISYIGFVSAYPFLLLFIINYLTQHEVPKRMAVAMFIIPLLTLVVVWIKPLQPWVWSGFSQGSVKYNVLVYHHGPWFWIHVIYLYLLLVIGVTLLIRAYLKAAPPYRQQIFTILIGVLFPVVTGTVYVLGIVPVPGMDITPAGLAFTGAFLAWAVLRYQLLDLLPVARATLIEQLQDGVIVLDKSHRVADINRASEKLLGWTPSEVVGKEISHLMPSLQEDFLTTRQRIRRDMFLKDSPGMILEIQSSTLNDSRKNEVGKLLVIRDVTARNRAESELQNANKKLKMQLEKNKKLQKELEQQALHDSLTGLFNRRIDEIIIKEFSLARRENKPVSLAMLDIDFFKKINDQHGHQDGDRLLQALSDYITKNIRQEDYAARYGGDEVMLVFPGMKKEDAIKKAEEIRVDFSKIRISSKKEGPAATISVGVASYPQDGENFEEVLRAADWALYLAKEEGRNRVRFVSSSETIGQAVPPN